MSSGEIRSRFRLLAATAAILLISIVALAPPAAVGAAARTADVPDTLVTIYTKLGYQGSAAAGTGIVIGSSGLVLTNNHVIRGATTLRAIDVGNGRTYKATVLGYSVASDVALLQLQNASGLETAEIGGSVKVGAAVTAYGNGGGDGIEEAGSSGTVRAVGRSITAGDGHGSGERLTGLIQSDVTLEPGDSGGPLVDANGRVVGMNTAASASFRFGGGQTSTQAFTIPIARALAISKM